jgi:CPA1 family monovalent cation:H+ antiporter
MITLGIVMGGYAAADALHISGPLAMVVAGIITGNKVKQDAMSETTRDYVGKFWELIDELLNAILFILVGFEMLEVQMDLTVFIAGVISIGIALLARYLGVAIPLLGLRWIKTFEKNVVPILTWGGLRGGISIALALSIPAEMHRDRIVAVTYIVVLFSILVQGLTIGKVARRLSS